MAHQNVLRSVKSSLKCSTYLFSCSSADVNVFLPCLWLACLLTDAGVHFNGSEIWSDIKRELLAIKMGSKHYQTVDTPKKEPQVGRRTVWYPSSIKFFASNFNFPNPSNLHHFIFSQFNLSFEKKYLFPKIPKNHPNIYTKSPNSG